MVIQKQDGKNVHPKISAELVGMKKKLGKSPSLRLPYCSAPTPEDRKCFAKNSGNFGRTSNGQVHFCFFRPEYSGSPLEDRSVRNLPFHFGQTCSLPYFSSLMQRINSWPSLIGKCHSIFLGYFYWSLTSRFGVNGMTPHVINTMINVLCPYFWISPVAHFQNRMSSDWCSKFSFFFGRLRYLLNTVKSKLGVTSCFYASKLEHFQGVKLLNHRIQN